MIFSLDSPRPQNPSTYYSMNISKSAQRILNSVDQMKNPSKTARKSSKKQLQNSLRFVKLAPLTPKGDSNEKSSENLNNRRRHHLNGVAPFLIVKNIISRCTFLSQTGMINGVSKDNNQDAVLAQEKINSVDYQTLLGVFDGHGENGHLISSHIKKSLIARIPLCPLDCIEEELADYLKFSIETCANEIIDGSVNSDYSGSTICLVLVTGKLLICGNVGDSRCVIGRFEEE